MTGIRYDIISGTLDIDPKGLNGGSTSWTEVRKAGVYAEENFISEIITVEQDGHRYFKVSQLTPVVLERFEYKFSELCNGKYDLASKLQPYRDSNKAQDDAASNDQKQAREIQRVQRVENVRIDPEVNKIAAAIVDANQKIVAQVLGGKEKALNSLVGMVIGEIRKQRLSNVGDAFSISIALKQKIAEKESENN